MVTKIVLVIPNFNISAPLNGLIEAKIRYIRAIAIEISEMLQLNSSLSGNIKICGELPTAAEKIVIKKTRNDIIQP